MKRLFYFSIIAVFVLLSCEKYDKTLSTYESCYLVENDSLISVNKDSLLSLHSPEGSKLIIKNKQDTIFVKTNVLKKKYSVLKNSGKIQRLTLFCEMVNSHDSTLAEVRFVNICQSEKFEISKGDKTFRFLGDISLFPITFIDAISSLHNHLNDEIKLMEQNRTATIVDTGSGK